jgi:glycosyltransferase involved in cell wall biosynthesis
VIASAAASGPAVSVCIRAYERPERLRAAIESVLAQTYSDFEIVVSDDSGRLGPVARAFGDPRVRYHANPHPAGPVANIRTAFGLARGRLLGLLDDDDRWLPGFLETVVERFERDPGVGVVFTDVFLETAGRRVPRRPSLAAGRHGNLARELLDQCAIFPSAAVMKRAVWEQGEREFPLLDSAAGDLTMWIRATLAGWTFHYVDEPLVSYRLHADQLTWSDSGLPTRVIATFERFRFDDPVCEDIRRARVAEARLVRAGAHLRRGRLRSARRDLAAARAIAPWSLGLRGWLAALGVRGWVVRRFAGRPRLLVAVVRVWSRVRPSVGPPSRCRRREVKRLVDGVPGWLGAREAWRLHETAYRHARRNPDLTAVEIGSWKGRSTTAIASGLERAGAGLLYAVDPHERSRLHTLTGEAATYPALRANLRRAGVDGRVRCVRSTSADARADFAERSVGLLFVDGSHEYEDVARDLDEWFPCLSEGATAAFHDAIGYPGVARLLSGRVLRAGSGFDHPRLVQNTLFVTRVARTRPYGRTRRSMIRARLLLRLGRLYARSRSAAARRRWSPRRSCAGRAPCPAWPRRRRARSRPRGAGGPSRPRP